jgi:DNA-directed RNA polymerase specialized sigma24 family protein
LVSPDELSRLWHAHAARLLLIARAIGEPAEDAVQEAFVRLAQQQVAPHEPLAWMVRVVRNQLIQWHRSGVRRDRRDQSVAADRSWFDAIDPADRLDAEIVVLHLWGELSFEQIAETVQLSRATAHRRYVEALHALRSRFDGASRDGSERESRKSKELT